MWFCLFCLLLLMGVAFYQSIQGLFSSLVFCVIAVISTAVAFTLYEYVAYEFLAAWKPDIALPVALAACFGLPLVLLRLAVDSLIRRSGLLPVLAEKIGGAGFGVITALLCVGVLTTAIQMLPWGGSFLTFSRFDLPQRGEEGTTPPAEVTASATRTRAGDDNQLWLSPDRFAAGFASMMSDGIFSGQQSFYQDHPDLLVEIGWSQAVAPGVRRVATPDEVSVEAPRIVDYVYRMARGGPSSQTTPPDPMPAESGHAFWVYRLRPGVDAGDSDGSHRFSLPQIRLVGIDRHENPVQFIPCAVRDASDATKHVRVERRRGDDRDILFELWQPGDDGAIEVVFEVPDGFEPSFISYKLGARAAVSKPSPSDRLPPPSRPQASPTPPSDRTPESPPADRPSGRRSSRRGARSDADSSPSDANRGGGRVTGVRTLATESRFSDQLPVTLTSYQATPGGQPEVGSGALREGSVHAQVAAQGAEGGQARIARFRVPPDKRLLQLSVRSLRAGSVLGKSLDFATRTLRNYIVTDDAGRRYEMAGQYAVANVDGAEVIEVQYYPGQIGSVGRGVREFAEISRQHLEQSETQLVFLFLVDRGRQVVEFSTGRRGRVDLRPYNLTAE